jgi:hypothetical protein
MRGNRGKRWAFCLIIVMLAGLFAMPGCAKKQKDVKPETTVMEAAFLKFKKAGYQEVGENNYWHLDFLKDYKDNTII